MHSSGRSLAFLRRGALENARRRLLPWMACVLWIALVAVACSVWSQDTQPASAETKTVPERALLVPQWIWVAAGDGESRWRFTRTFAEKQAIQSARLRFAADFCRATVLVNGQAVLRVEPYCPTQDVDVTAALRRGDNSLEVRVEPVAGPAAIALSLDWKPIASEPHTLVSDRQWRVAPLRKDANDNAASADAPADELGFVPVEQWGIGRRGIALAADDNYEQWQQTLGPDAAHAGRESGPLLDSQCRSSASRSPTRAAGSAWRSTIAGGSRCPARIVACSA